MVIEVEILGTGQIAEFPDGTDPATITQALAKFRTGATQDDRNILDSGLGTTVDERLGFAGS